MGRRRLIADTAAVSAGAAASMLASKPASAANGRPVLLG